MKVVSIWLEWLFLPGRRVQIISSSIQLEASLDLMIFFFLRENLKYITASFSNLYSRTTCIPSFHKLITSIEAHLTWPPNIYDSGSSACSGLWLWFTTVHSKCGSSLVAHHVQLWAALIFSERWHSALLSESVLPCLSQQAGPSSAPDPCSTTQLRVAAHLLTAWAL